MINDIDFARPGFFYLLLLLLPLIVWYILREKDSHATMQVSTIDSKFFEKKSFKLILRHILFGLRLLIAIILIVALARPQSSSKWEDQDVFGIDIMLSVDVSSSMLAKDFKPDRLEAAKKVASDFIIGRSKDRIGLVVFSGESFTQCPLTSDHRILLNLFKDINSGMIEDGTAIGVGLANAVKRLKDSKTKSKVIILLTDGVNNKGAIEPITAAQLAQTFGIRVYTIGVGTMGEALYPYYDVFGQQHYTKQKVEIDEETLKQIADITGGQYFRATNENKLREIYQEIDNLEKSKIKTTEFKKKEERFMPFIWLALVLLLIEIVVKRTVLRSIP